MAKKDKKNKNSETPFSSRISSDSHFVRAGDVRVRESNTGKAINALASMKLSKRERDSILSAIESHERSPNSPQ